MGAKFEEEVFQLEIQYEKYQFDKVEATERTIIKADLITRDLTSIAGAITTRTKSWIVGKTNNSFNELRESFV